MTAPVAREKRHAATSHATARAHGTRDASAPAGAVGGGVLAIGGLDAAAVEFLAERVAERVLERLGAAAVAASAPVGLVDASVVAEALGVSRQWVYEHRDELGVQRLGGGPRPRLRFDLERARAVFACSVGRPSQDENRLCGAESVGPPAASGRRLPNRLPATGSVLAIRPGRA